MPKKYVVNDGKRLLVLHALKGGRYGVTCPDDPALITEGESFEDAISMADDAAKSLARARSKEAAESKSRRKAKSA